jgi:hypothetical protein
MIPSSSGAKAGEGAVVISSIAFTRMASSACEISDSMCGFTSKLGSSSSTEIAASTFPASSLESTLTSSCRVARSLGSIGVISLGPRAPSFASSAERYDGLSRRIHRRITIASAMTTPRSWRWSSSDPKNRSSTPPAAPPSFFTAPSTSARTESRMACGIGL